MAEKRFQLEGKADLNNDAVLEYERQRGEAIRNVDEDDETAIFRSVGCCGMGRDRLMNSPKWPGSTPDNVRDDMK